MHHLAVTPAKQSWGPLNRFRSALLQGMPAFAGTTGKNDAIAPMTRPR